MEIVKVMNRNIIFVGGIHGVGKTTLCSKIINRTGLKHFSASELIKKVKHDDVCKKRKLVPDINENQNYLSIALNEYMNEDLTYLLDGHFCLLNNEGAITRIPFSTFQDVSPSCIVTVSDSVDNIISRLSKRDSETYDDKYISLFQKEEIEYSKYIAKSLRVPFYEFEMKGDIDSLVFFILNATGRASL